MHQKEWERGREVAATSNLFDVVVSLCLIESSYSRCELTAQLSLNPFTNATQHEGRDLGAVVVCGANRNQFALKYIHHINLLEG